jgi:hypothetical protein
MSNKFHINKNGDAAACGATVKACPLGGEHFDSREDAEMARMNSQQEAFIKDAVSEEASEQQPAKHAPIRRPAGLSDEEWTKLRDDFSYYLKERGSTMNEYKDFLAETNSTFGDEFAKCDHGLTGYYTAPEEMIHNWAEHDVRKAKTPYAEELADKLLMDHFDPLESEVLKDEFAQKLLDIDYWNESAASNKPRIEHLGNGFLRTAWGQRAVTEEYKEDLLKDPDFTNMVKAFVFDKKMTDGKIL